MLPAAVVRILVGLRRGSREALDGFTIGALRALSFTTADDDGGWHLVRLGLLNNIAAAAAVHRRNPVRGGGPADRDRAGRTDRDPAVVRSVRSRPAPRTRAGRRAAPHAGRRAVYTAIWLIDESPLPRWPQLALHIVMTAIALLAARFCVQLAFAARAPARTGANPGALPELRTCGARHGVLPGLRVRREHVVGGASPAPGTPPTKAGTAGSADV